MGGTLKGSVQPSWVCVFILYVVNICIEKLVCLGFRSRQEGGRMLLLFTCDVEHCGSPCLIGGTVRVRACVCVFACLHVHVRS